LFTVITSTGQSLCTDVLLCVVMCSHTVLEMPLGDFFNEQYTFALKMNSLGLTDGEIGLLTAIMIMNPGQL